MIENTWSTTYIIFRYGSTVLSFRNSYIHSISYNSEILTFDNKKVKPIKDRILQKSHVKHFVFRSHFKYCCACPCKCKHKAGRLECKFIHDRNKKKVVNYYQDFWCNKDALCKIVEYLLSEVEAIAQLYYWTIIKAAFVHKVSKLLWKITTNNPKQNIAIAMLANLVVRLVGALLFNFGGGRSLLDVLVMTSQIILPCWSLCV